MFLLASLSPLATLSFVERAGAQEYDTIIGEARTLETPGEHWFAAIGNFGGDIAYIVDGDAGDVRGSMTLSMFSPAIAPAVASGRIYSYGSYYTRTYYGEREDVVQTFDLETLRPVKEVQIPPKSAGLGHSGMIGLIADRYVGVWNITPAMSVSIVDTVEDRFVGEISTPGCAGVFPLGAGFLMACGDGRVQYVRLDAAGQEIDRIRSDAFFSTSEDPVFDYAVPTADGWLFLSLEGMVYEVSMHADAISVAEPWSINPPDEADARDANGVPIAADDQWRIGGLQPFAYNPETGLLLTLMHEGGGQETFEDPGSQIWAFSTRTRRRGYVLDLQGEKARSVVLTRDAAPLMLLALASSPEVQVRDGWSSQLLHRMTDMDVRRIQPLK